MTATEAIKQLQTEHDLIAGERDLDGSQFAPALLEALAMAVEALKTQDMTLYMNLPEVSAEEAVEILKRNNRIELLPPAQPEKTQLSGESTTKDSTFDCISRQAAIDAINKMKIYRPLDSDRYVLSDCLDKIVDLPPAKPEIIRCKYCKHSKEWYKDKRRCFLWHEEGIDVFEDGYCNYAKRRTRGEQDG